MNGPFLDPLMTEQVWEGAQGHIQKKACGEDNEQVHLLSVLTLMTE